MKQFEPTKHAIHELPSAPIKRQAVEIQAQQDEFTASTLRECGIPDEAIECIIPLLRREHTRLDMQENSDGTISTVTVFRDDPAGTTPPEQLFMIDVPFTTQHDLGAIRAWSETPGKQMPASDSGEQVLLKNKSTLAE